MCPVPRANAGKVPPVPPLGAHHEVKGSSATIRAGLHASACAIVTRCRSPPESRADTPATRLSPQLRPAPTTRQVRRRRRARAESRRSAGGSESTGFSASGGLEDHRDLRAAHRFQRAFVERKQIAPPQQHLSPDLVFGRWQQFEKSQCERSLSRAGIPRKADNASPRNIERNAVQTSYVPAAA